MLKRAIAFAAFAALSAPLSAAAQDAVAASPAYDAALAAALGADQRGHAQSF